jgi:hypothetical protein
MQKKVVEETNITTNLKDACKFSSYNLGYNSGVVGKITENY